MKVLAISHLPEEKFSSRLHLQFLHQLRKFCSYEFLPGQLIDQNSWSAEDIFFIYQPNVVILYDSHAPGGKQTMFAHNFFADFPCKKVMIEVDFWKKSGAEMHPWKDRWGDLSWYSSNKFDLILKRGCSGDIHEVDGIPAIWLPFSASEEFYPWKWKRKKVGFAGAFHYNKPIADGVICYEQRRKAMTLLKEAGLLERCSACRSLEGSRDLYPQFLRENMMGLTSAETGSPHGKVFEIMASGSVLLSPKFKNQERLFGSDPCFVEYAEDCSDIVELAQEVISNSSKYREVAQRAVSVIEERHRSSYRVAELYDHLDRLVRGKSLINRWEV